MNTFLGGTHAPKKLRFNHQLSSMHVSLVESVCSNCSSFVGASSRPEVLRFVEKLHMCARKRDLIRVAQPSA
jgi:hypothetical protein